MTENTNPWVTGSRRQPRPCEKCGYVFNTWGMAWTKCLLCDPIPVKQAKVYFAQIQNDDPLVKL